MPKPFERLTDKAFDRLMRKVAAVYAQAAREIKSKMADWGRKFAAKNADLQAQLAAGLITKSEYQTWLTGQVFTGKQWQKKLDSVTDILVNADGKAAALIRGETSAVFAENANYAAYELEKDLGGAVNFQLYDTKTVQRLIRDNPKMLPEWKIDEEKDYVWNEKRVQNALTQGILQGESVSEIGDRLARELSSGNDRKMRTFARTAVTGAQNAGRQERMEEIADDMEEAGIELKKRWDATLDNRTRDAHAELDGVTIDVDESFHNRIGSIRYPGDPTADPANVYNCRCTLSYVYPQFAQQRNRRAYRTVTDENGNERRESYIAGDVTYAEWKMQKEAGK